METVCRELQSSYWAKDRTREIILESIKASLNFSLFLEGVQVGFARVVTDYSTIAYLCDVFVVGRYQGQGLGKQLIGAVIGHPSLAGVKWILRTKDAHRFYAHFGFATPAKPEKYMEREALLFVEKAEG
jgi:GNAT superfamily N-acetyltransferase